MYTHTHTHGILVPIRKVKDLVLKYKYQIALAVILTIGILVRVVGITKYPAGLNQDEASAGYEAYSILSSGMDRHGNSFPAQFILFQ